MINTKPRPEDQAGVAVAGSLVKVQVDDYRDGNLMASIGDVIPGFMADGKEA